MAKGKSGGKRANGTPVARDIDEFDAMYQREMDKIHVEMAEEERQLDAVQEKIDAWLNDKNSTSLDEVERPDGNAEPVYLEKETKKNIIDYYLKEYNNGYFNSDEDMISVLYKDGSMVSSFDEPKKFKLTNIESIIVDGSWGTTFCGNVKVTHDTPDDKFSITRGGGTAVRVGSSGYIRRLPKYNGFSAAWHVDFE